MRNISLITLCILFIGIQDGFAENWGHWRGPSGTSVAADSHPPVEWSDTKNVQWKVAVPGRGSGSPVVWGDQVFVVTAISAQGDDAAADVEPEPPRRGRRGRGGRRAAPREQQFQLLSYDRNTGDLKWQQTATVATPHEGTHSTNGYASASPCTDGEHVYAHFGSYGLYCYTLSGDLKWKRNDFGEMETRNEFGEGSSPTISGDTLLVPWDHEGPSALYALNKRTGETIWRTDRDEPTCWATPLVISHGGKQQVIMNGQTCARSYDLATGKELWRCGGQTQRPVATPVADDEFVYVGSGHRGSFFAAFRPDGEGDIEGSENVVWTIDRDTPDIASALLSSGRLYFHKAKTGILSCVDAKTGKPHYSASRIEGLTMIYASPVGAGGHIYLTDRAGTTVVIKDAATLEIVATNSVGETVDATPAPVGNQLFIRGEKHLFCIAE